MNLELQSERTKFLQELGEVLDEFFSESAYPTTLKKKTEQMIEHLIPEHEYAIMSFLVPKLAKIIKPDLSDEKIQMANTLGWIFQMFQSCYIVIDDFVDEGDERYGKITWTKMQNHSKSIIMYDVSILRAVTLFALQKKYSHSPAIYLQLLHLFLHCENKAAKAYRLETHLLIENFRNGTTTLESYNMKLFELMSSLKFGSIWFCLPMSLAMVTAGYQMEENGELYKKIEVFAGHFGNLFQVLDDYLDSFSTKPGYDTKDTDIRRGQFSWCLLTAKSLCTSEDEVVNLFNHYGRDNEESVDYIKSLYEKIDIHRLLNEYREKACENVLNDADRLFGKTKEIRDMVKWVLNWGVNVHQG